MVVFGQKWLCSGKCGCIRAKVAVFVQNGCIRATWLYSDKVNVFSQGDCIWTKVVVFGQKWLYLGKVVVFDEKRLSSGKRGCTWTR